MQKEMEMCDPTDYATFEFARNDSHELSEEFQDLSEYFYKNTEKYDLEVIA